MMQTLWLCSAVLIWVPEMRLLSDIYNQSQSIIQVNAEQTLRC